MHHIDPAVIFLQYEGQTNALAQSILATAYRVIACILLVNLLVALFGATFSNISEAADLRYNLERARIVLAFEQVTMRSFNVSE